METIWPEHHGSLCLLHLLRGCSILKSSLRDGCRPSIGAGILLYPRHHLRPLLRKPPSAQLCMYPMFGCQPRSRTLGAHRSQWRCRTWHPPVRKEGRCDPYGPVLSEHCRRGGGRLLLRVTGSTATTVVNTPSKNTEKPPPTTATNSPKSVLECFPSLLYHRDIHTHTHT